MDSSTTLIDSLTAHISLYHHSSSSSSSSSNSNPRTSILRWFSSLTIHQRQSYLTIFDGKFIKILSQMQTKLLKNGHGFFILLPDLPSGGDDRLPTLCFRRSKGLLTRVSQSNQAQNMVYQSIRLFTSSPDTTDMAKTAKLDCMTVSEEMVRDVDRFVEVMDSVSGGEFLRGEDDKKNKNNANSSSSGSNLIEWKEMNWLKGKGYYSIEAFLVNRLEIALRLSWLHCNVNNNNHNKRRVKEKEVNVAGVASNIYWRNKGCMDWWEALDPGLKNNILRIVLGKASKFLVLITLALLCFVLFRDNLCAY